MIPVSLNISSDGSETGGLLQKYLQDRGVYDKRGPAQVGYGVNCRRSQPSLNGACQSDKISRMRRMQEAGVSLVPWAVGRDAYNLQLPLFARKLYGMGAKDLMPVFQREEIDWRLAAGWQWFSSIVPIMREMRAWVWRGTILTMFEKQMHRPEDYKGLGRNFGQGFEFSPTSSFSQAHQQHSINAVNALGLDFAAIDFIEDPQGHVFVLEANTAPGAIRSGAQDTLARLADRIAD